MAKRNIQNSQVEDTPDYLIKPKSHFEESLNQRINIGEELISRQIRNQEECHKLHQDYEFWNDFNAELIKRAFNKSANQYYKDYTSSPGIFIANLYDTPSLQEEVQELRTKISQRQNRLKKIKEKIILIEELPELSLINHVKSAKNPQDVHLETLKGIFSNFHKVAQSLRHRHGSRETLIIKDEYDVQDLLRSILQINFSDIREEDYSPSYVGGNSRVDFVLKDEKIVVETKMTTDHLKDKEIGSQLLIDIGRYRSHPDCKLLAVFIYDKGDHIRNKTGLINDLEKMTTSSLKVNVFINPS